MLPNRTSSLFLDAEWEGTPGEVKAYEVKPAPHRQTASFTHQMDPEVLLTAAEVLYGRTPARLCCERHGC